MKSKIVIFALAASALLAACNGGTTPSSSTPAASSETPIVVSSEHGGISAEFDVAQIFETNASGDVVQVEDSKEGFTAEIAQGEAETKPTLANGIITLTAGSTMTIGAVDPEILYTDDLIKNALKFDSAITADSLAVSTGTTIEIVDNGLTAELTVPENAKTYTITAKEELKLKSVVLATTIVE